MGGTTRVLVVDDSELATLALIELLAIDPTISVVGTAQSGSEAIELTSRLRPDLIMMDVNMPALSGIDASEQIMSRCPTPILLITSGYDRSAGAVAFRALQSGALDVVEKPQGGPGMEHQARALADHVKLLAGVPVIRHVRAGLRAAFATARAETPVAPLEGAVDRRVVAIAASTGGPAAIATVLSGLPGDFAAPVLVVQHMIPEFTRGFVSWLDAACALPVRLARDGERAEPGAVLVAPDGAHMTVTSTWRVRLVTPSEPALHCPSADALFTSVAQAFGPRGVGLLLTGMGRDGAQGLLAMRDAGALTAAQEGGSCVVDGMPRAARELGAAEVVAVPRELPRVLLDAVARTRLAAARTRAQ